MTTIVARKYKDRIVLASESQTTWGTSFKTNSHSAKIQKINDFFHVGCAGSVRFITFLEEYCKINKDMFLHGKNVSRIAVIDFFENFNKWAKEKYPGCAYFEKDRVAEIYALIVIHKKIFAFEDNTADEIRNFWAIGSGKFIALGALEAGCDPNEAVKIAKKYDLYSGGKICERVISLK